MARILLASEDLALTQHVGSTLSAEGHSVVDVSNGLDAYLQTLSQQPQIVLLDAVLAVHNGFETCRMIRDDPEAPRPLPIVLLCGDAPDPKKLEQADATGYIDRNAASVAIRERIANLLSEFGIV